MDNAKPTAAMLEWLKWISAGGEISHSIGSKPEAKKTRKRYGYDMDSKLVNAGLITYERIKASEKYDIYKRVARLTPAGMEAIGVKTE